MNRLVHRELDADGAGSGAATNQYWVYDEGINAILQFDGSAASNLAHRYLWSNQVDELFADEQVTSLSTGGNTLWGLGDHLGTLRDIADFNESTSVTSVTNHRTYNAFGKMTAETNSSVDLLFGFTGKQLDEDTGLQHNLNRWYDAGAGQWLSNDPIGFAAGDANLYRYVGNGPQNWTDPSGLAHKGHHKVVGPIRYIVPKAAFKVFDSPGARITNDFYKSHKYDWFGGIHHSHYNDAVIKEFEDFIGKNGINPKKMNAEQARLFLKHLDDLPTKHLIKTFNKGVRAAADAAESAGKAAAKAAAKAGKAFKVAKGSGKLAKAIPFWGAFVSAGMWGVDGYSKGAVNGTINSGIDAIPFVGAGKILIELTITGDWIPDAQSQSPVEKEYDDSSHSSRDLQWIEEFGGQYPNE